MKSKRFFAPSFLTKFDNYLLLNKPEIWSARAHWVVYYSIIFITLFAGLCFVVPNDARSFSQVFGWIGFMMIICFLAIIGWLLFLLRFNVFKRFGAISPVGTLRSFLLYFISAGIIMLIAFVQPAVETIRANHTYGDEELINDINTININICTLEFDSLPHDWSSDTTAIVEHPKTYGGPAIDTVMAVDTSIIQTPVTHEAFNEIDTAELARLITNGDSLIKINDTLYNVFTTPNFLFLNGYQVHKRLQSLLFTSKQLYYKARQQHIKTNRDKLQKEISAIVKKYNYQQLSYYDDYDDNDYVKDFNRNYKAKYSITKISGAVNNVAERKFRWGNEKLPVFIRIFFYFSFVIALFVFAFRHSTIKCFFLSLLTAFILYISSSLIGIFFKGSINFSIVWFMFCFAASVVLSTLVFQQKVRHLITGISINLFVFLISFMPMILVAYFKAINSNYYSNYNNDSGDYYLYAEILGIAGFLILLPTYIYRLYRKWYALPDN